MVFNFDVNDIIQNRKGVDQFWSLVFHKYGGPQRLSYALCMSLDLETNVIIFCSGTWLSSMFPKAKNMSKMRKWGIWTHNLVLTLYTTQKELNNFGF